MKINWKDHLVNLFVVIVGITIAFWLNSWGEDRKAQKIEKQYLNGVIKDLEDDMQDLDFMLQYGESQIIALNKLLDIIIGKNDGYDSLVYDLFLVQYNQPFTPQDASYGSLSSKIEIVEDFEVRKQIIRYYNQYYTSMELWDLACKENIDDFLKPVLNRELIFKGRNQIDYKIFESVELGNALFSLRNLLNRKLDYCKNFRDTGEELRSSLETYLQSL